MDCFDLRQWKGYRAAGGDPSLPALIDQAVIDSRLICSPHALFTALKGSQKDGHDFISTTSAKYALVSHHWQGKSRSHLLRVDDPLKAFQEIAEEYRKQLPGKVIAICGSYGKTMVKDLIYELLKQTGPIAASPESFNSQIGVPLSLFQATSAHRHILIESGFSLPGEMSRLAAMIQPNHTLLTYVGKKHLHTLGSRDRIASEIKHLFPQSLSSWSILPNDPLIQPPQTSFFWDLPHSELPHAFPNNEQGMYELRFPDGNCFQLPRPPGTSYFLNLVNLAVKPAYLLGALPESIIEVLKDYQPEPMRTEIWKNQGGATLVNETYCGDPQSIDSALKHFSYRAPKGKKVLLYHGIRSNDPAIPSRIAQTIKDARTDILLLAESHPALVEEVRTQSPSTEIQLFTSVEDALQTYQTKLRPEDILVIKGKRKLPLDALTQAIQGSIFTNQCRINLAAVSSNLKQIRSRISPKTELMVMVKAMAYGTHDAIMAKFLQTQGVRKLGVSYVDEGISLRKEGVEQDIFVLNAAPFESDKAVHWGFETAVNDLESIRNIARAAEHRQQQVKVHLHIDTGMSRLGCRPEEALQLACTIHQHTFLQLEGVMTHFACADDPKQDRFTKEQAERFDHTLQEIENAGIPIPWKHACNSHGALRFSFPQYNMVRTGLGIYGFCPEGTLALTLTSRIVGINHCLKGETISYGRNYTVAEDRERIAVIPIGYFDGLHLNYSGKGEVMIHGIKAPMVGKICMDYMMVNITHIPQAVIGDSVLIFGEDEEGCYLPPETLAGQGNSSVYELMTCLGPRIQRIFIHEENDKIT
jgi:Alr-MurF fusion protein